MQNNLLNYITMSERIFLRPAHPNMGEEDTILVSLRSNFESLNVCETYGDYGQQVGCCNAGCYTLENSECSAQSDCSSAITKEFNVCVSIERIADKFTVIPTDDDEEFPDELIENIDAFIEGWQKENENHTECTGYTYLDGSNFATIVIDHEHDSNLISHVEIDEGIEAINEAIENRSFVKGEFGQRIYEYGDYIIIDNYCQGHWESWQVKRKDV